MPESKGLELTISNLPEKYKDRILERRRTHGTRRTTFRDFKITLPPRPAEQPRTPEQILQRPENVFDNNFSTRTPTPKMKNNDRSRSSQMSLGSPMEIDYSINVGNIEVLISKGKYNDDEERSDIVIMDEVNILDKSPGKQLVTILDEVDIPEKFSEEQLGNEGNEVDDRDEEEVNVQDKSSEEQLDIDMDDVEVVKSSDEQEQVTEEKELSQNKRRSSRRKSKNEREIVNDKDKIPARSSKMHIDTEKDMEDKSSEEQIVETTEDTEKVIEISKGKKKPTRRHKNIVRRGVVKNKGKASAKSPEQINTVMNEVVPDKSFEEQEKVTEINEEASEKNQNKRRSTRRKNIVKRDIVKNKDKISAKSPEQIDTVMDDVIPDKSSDEKEEEEEQNAGTAEEANEINQSRKRRTRRRNEVGREIVKNKGKTSAKSSKQIDITMDKVVPDKSSDDVTGISQNKKRPTRHKKTVKNKGKPTVKSPEISDTVMDEDIPEDASVILPEDQNVAEESINQPSEETMDLEEAFEEQTAINQSRKKSSRLKIKCHKIGSSTIQDKDGNIVKKTSAAKLNELDIIGDAINDTIIEFLFVESYFFPINLIKEIQYFKNEIELHLLEQSDLFDEQIMMRSSLRKSKTQMNCLRKEMLDVQRERDKVRKELANERRIFVNEEQERKKLEQAHNFLTDLETLREAVDAEDNMQEDQEDEGILDGFKGLLVSVTSRKGRFDALCRFNMLLEMCEKIVRQATDT
ncbi:2935_t:CDS:10 [Rhizophagus irregularis]|nr:2935_t:CDS:10 [Rhizophagus irregularis]